jgi:hypothetical protein
MADSRAGRAVAVASRRLATHAEMGPGGLSRRLEEGAYMRTGVKRLQAGGMASLFGLAVVVAVGAGCASTQMDSTWTDPSARGNDIDKMAVIYMGQDEGVRRMAEDEVAKKITAAQVVPSYVALAGVDLDNREQVRSKLQAGGFDGVMVMRLASVTEQPVAVDGPYGTFDGYYGWAAPNVYDDDYLVEETIVRMISNVYDVDQNKLIWSGTSETFDPDSAKQLVDDVSRKVAENLQKEQIIR